MLSLLLAELQWSDYLGNVWAFCVSVHLFIWSQKSEGKTNHWSWNILVSIPENFWRKQSIRSPLLCSQSRDSSGSPLSFPRSSHSWDYLLWCDVLDVIDYPPLSWGPESDLLGAFVRNQLGKNKNKNLKASSGWPEIRGPQSHLSLAWQNNLNNKKIHKKIFSFQGLEGYSSFHPPCQHDTTPM